MPWWGWVLATLAVVAVLLVVLCLAGLFYLAKLFSTGDE
jgi:hypothetical protein